VVAHRLTTVRKCDQICVLDGGGVKELGSHSELLKKKGLYSELWMKQGGGDKDE
jgi:ABC-type multidrug transport system fused ATPase/permease subunit